MNLFGKKKAEAPRAPALDPLEAVKKLQDTLDTLEKRENHITKKMEACVQEAKEKLAKKDKKGAMFALKRKKMLEKEVEKLQGARITLDSQVMSLQSASVNIETFKAMDQGARAMKNIRGNIDADKVDDMMDAMQEERDIHDAISDAISRPAQDMFDDEELLNELNELEELEMEVEEPEERTSVPSYNLPSVPTANVQVNGAKSRANSAANAPQESEEEKALRELQSMMA